MKNLVKLFFILGPGLFTGCLATDTDINSLRSQMAQLTHTITQLQESQASLGSKIEDLSTDIKVNNENMNETGILVSRLSAKLDDMGVINSAVADMQAEMLPSKMFDSAKTSFNEKKYDRAVEGFNLYLKKYPKGEMVEEANCLIADSYAAQKDNKKAAVAYAKLMQSYPKSKNMPAYRHKYAKAILPLGKKAEAKKYLQSIVQDYPNSPEAKIAKRDLQSLK